MHTPPNLLPFPPNPRLHPPTRPPYRIARADPFWEVFDTLVMPPQLGKATAGRLRLKNCTGQQVEWTVSLAGPAKVTLSSHQLRLLQDSPHEYQLQVRVCVSCGGGVVS